MTPEQAKAALKGWAEKVESCGWQSMSQETFTKQFLNLLKAFAKHTARIKTGVLVKALNDLGVQLSPENKEDFAKKVGGVFSSALKKKRNSRDGSRMAPCYSQLITAIQSGKKQWVVQTKAKSKQEPRLPLQTQGPSSSSNPQPQTGSIWDTFGLVRPAALAEATSLDSEGEESEASCIIIDAEDEARGDDHDPNDVDDDGGEYGLDPTSSEDAGEGKETGQEEEDDASEEQKEEEPEEENEEEEEDDQDKAASALSGSLHAHAALEHLLTKTTAYLAVSRPFCRGLNIELSRGVFEGGMEWLGVGNYNFRALIFRSLEAEIR